MNTNFRQGIITAQRHPRFVTPSTTAGCYNLDASISPTIVNFSEGSSNYLLTENVSVTNAWTNVPTGVECWLYWDISKEDATRTFGYTLYNPFVTIAPTNPQINQMYFDTVENRPKAWTGQYWMDVIRVIAAHVDAQGNVVIQSTGSQINLMVPCITDVIVLDNKLKPIKKYTNDGYEFYNRTTIIDFKNDQRDTFKYQRLVDSHGTASEPIQLHYCVTWDNYNRLKLADPSDINSPAFALATRDVATDEIVGLYFSGFITDRSSWNWTQPPHTILYVGQNGEISTQFDPLYSIQRIGYISTPNTIYVEFTEQYLAYVQPTPSITPSTSVLPSPTPTPTPSVSATVTATPMSTVTPTITSSVSVTPSATIALSPSPTPSPPSVTPTLTSAALFRLSSSAQIDHSYVPVFDGSNQANTLALSLDGTKLYVGGNINGVSPHKGLFRLNLDSSIDNTFTFPLDTATANSGVGNPIVTFFKQTASNIIYAAGDISLTVGGTYTASFIKMDANGVVDTTFGLSSNFKGQGNNIKYLMQAADGHLYVSIGNGSTTYAVKGMFRLNSDGSLDTTYDTSQLPYSGVGAMVQHPTTGMIYMFNGFVGMNGSTTTTGHIIRLNADGSIDNSYTPIVVTTTPNGYGTPTIPSTMTVTADGKIYFAGLQTSITNGTVTYYALTRLNSDGTLDTSFSGVYDSTTSQGQYIAQIYQTADGNIYLMGSLGQPIIKKLSSSGVYDPSYTNILHAGAVDCMQQIPNGSIYAGGNVNYYN